MYGGTGIRRYGGDYLKINEYNFIEELKRKNPKALDYIYDSKITVPLK